MIRMKLVLLIGVMGCGVAVLAQSVPSGTHPAASDPHPAKGDAHPAAPVEKHPANPGYAEETNNSASTWAAVSAPQPFTTNSINTAAALTQNFSVPTFVPTPTVVQPATNGVAGGSQAATNSAVTTPPPPQTSGVDGGDTGQ